MVPSLDASISSDESENMELSIYVHPHWLHSRCHLHCVEKTFSRYVKKEYGERERERGRKIEDSGDDGEKTLNYETASVR